MANNYSDVATGNASTPRNLLPVKTQRNLWGQTIDPHRVDLWYVDFELARHGIRGEFDLKQAALPTLLPQHIQSVALPENVKIRAEPVRRESIAYSMPSWDEPLEPIVVSMILDDTTPNPVISLLEYWTALVRAGRGLRSRNGGFITDVVSSDFVGPVLPTPQRISNLQLDETFKINFRFPLHIFVLQGAISTTPSASTAQSAIDAAKGAVQMNIATRTAVRIADALKVGDTLGAQLIKSVVQEQRRRETDYCVLNAVKTWTARVWPSSYRVSELNYASNGVVTVSVTFQTEFLNMQAYT